MSEFLVTADDIVKQEHENDLLDAKYEVNVLEDIIKTEDICSEDDQFQCENVTANSVLLKKEQENVLLDTKYEISYFEDDIKREDVCAEDNDIVKLESSSSESVTPNTDVLKKEQEDDLMDDEYEISSLEDNIKTEDLCSEDEKFQLDNESVKLESSSSESDTEKVKKQPKPKKCYIPSRSKYSDTKLKEIKSYICDLCPSRFVDAASLYFHMKYHAGVRRNVCTYCRKGFITKTELDIHQKRHSNKKEYACDQCDRYFKSSGGRYIHKLMVHTDHRKWKYLCRICNKRFPLKSRYDVHMKRHSSDERFECVLCQKLFIERWHLGNHMINHDSVAEFKFSCCEKEYKQKGDLKVHIIKCHGIGVGEAKPPPEERPFICHLCPKAYCHQRGLTKHLHTHSSEKQHKV